MKTRLRAYADSEDPDQLLVSQSDQGLYFALVGVLNTTEYVNG